MLISVLIPAFNEEKYLHHSITKIRKAFESIPPLEGRWELIVCDNNSSDSTSRIANEAGAKVVFEEVNQISRARNKAASQARGQWFLFIDADTHPTSQLLKEVYSIIHMNTYIGCGATISVRGGSMFNRLRLERLNPVFRWLKLCGGAFLLCRRDAYQELGGFGDHLYAYEDVDFVIRLKRYGRKDSKKFKIISRYPVITSGRKGEYSPKSMYVLFISNIFAVMIFILSLVLPRSFVKKIAGKGMGYWYGNR